MDEASFLADQIGILKNGNIKYSGTIIDIINEYGKYITIQINKKKDEKIKQLLYFINENLILKNNPNYSNDEINSINGNEKNLIDNLEDSLSTKISEKSSKALESLELKVYKERIIIKIPTKLFNFKKADIIFKKIEEEYKINNYIILKDQLEDAFINAIKDEKKDNKKDYLVLSEVDKYTYIYKGFKKFKNELSILFKKRLIEISRDKKSFILEILFPILLTVIACLVSYLELLENNKTTSIELYNFNNDSQVVYYALPNNNSNIYKYSFLIIENDLEKKELLKNYKFYDSGLKYNENYNLLENLIIFFKGIYENNMSKKIKNNYANYFLITDDDNKHYYEFATYISTRQRHSSIAFSNNLLKKIIEYELSKSDKYKYDDINIEIIHSPFPLTYEEKNNKKIRNGFSLVFFISIALSLIPSNFITIIIREKENKSKQLQLLSGLSIFTYWINNFIFEIIKYYVVVGICLIILSIFSFYEKYLIILYIFYGPALVSFTYVLSYFLNSEGKGQIIILLINLFFGTLGSSAVLILRTNQKLKKLGIILSFFFRFIPSFCICYGYNQLISKKVLFAID